MTRLTLCLAVLVALTTGACVKKSDFEALERKCAAEQQALQTSLEEERQRGTALAEELKREQDKSRSQADEIARLTSDLDSAQKRQVELQNQVTDMVHDSSKLKASIQEMQAALAALNEQKRQTEARIAEYKKLLASFKSLIDAGKLKVKVVGGRMIVELPSDVLFGSGSIELSESGKSGIAEIGTILATMQDRQFQVEGHTDDQPIKTARFPNNWALAAGRAIAVAEMLVKAGLQPTNVSAASFGEFRPVASNATPQGRAQNRRIEIVLVPDLSQVPGFEELERAAKP
ncbi:MAG TPA: OmpA family protein [Polyangiaceae bacterium]|nr:OmpA family protein [Polyangiaceae bacterium]